MINLNMNSPEYKTYDSKYIPIQCMALVILGIIQFYPPIKLLCLCLIGGIVAFNVAVVLSILYQTRKNVESKETKLENVHE